MSGGSFNTPEDIRKITAAATRLQEVFNFTKQPGNEDYAAMAAVKEKLGDYKEHQAFFSNRLHDHLETQVEILSETYLKEKDRYSKKGDLKLVAHDLARVNRSFETPLRSNLEIVFCFFSFPTAIDQAQTVLHTHRLAQGHGSS